MTFEQWCKANGEPVYKQTEPVYDWGRWRRNIARYLQYLDK